MHKKRHEYLRLDNNSKISDEVACEHENKSVKEEGVETEFRKWVTVQCDVYGRWRLRWQHFRRRGVGEHQAKAVRVQKTDRSVLGRPRLSAVECVFLFEKLKNELRVKRKEKDNWIVGQFG